MDAEEPRHSAFAGSVACRICKDTCEPDFPCWCCYELRLVMGGCPPVEGVL